MSQKKPTTNQQLEEMRGMIENMAPAKIVTIDRELQERVTTLMLMLYGATAKYGIGSRGDDGVIVTAQVPVLQVPADQSLQWEVAADGKSVMLYIVLSDEPKESAPEAKESVSPAPAAPGVEPIEVGVYGVENVNEPPAPGTSITRMEDDERATIVPPTIEPAVGDEFEDEIKVGLGDEPTEGPGMDDPFTGDDYDGH